MKKTHKPYGDFAPRLGSEEPEQTTFGDCFIIFVTVAFISLILVGAIDTIIGWF